MTKDFTKEFFQAAWGEKGYYENFSYGVGIDRVCKTCLIPFYNVEHNALEIGCGGGVFTEKMLGRFYELTVVDVIKNPFGNKTEHFKYIELPNHSNDLQGIYSDSIDFCFSYNVFCHMSNDFLRAYLKSIHGVLKEGGNLVFMLSNYNNINHRFEDSEDYGLGELLPMGHFYQDERTLDVIAGKGDWDIISRNMIPEHRDIIVHLKKN